MATDITELLELVEKKEKLQEDIKKWYAEVGKIDDKLKKDCPHPTTIRKHDHYAGSYYDRSETISYDLCTICGTRLNETSRQGHYG